MAEPTDRDRPQQLHKWHRHPTKPFKVSKPEQWPKWIRRIEHFRSASGLAMKDGRVQVGTLLYAMGSDGDNVRLSFHLAEDDAHLLMATTHLFAHATRTHATAVSTTTPTLRCYSTPPILYHLGQSLLTLVATASERTRRYDVSVGLVIQRENG